MQIYRVRRRIWPIPAIAVIAFTATLVFNHVVTLKNSRLLISTEEVSYPLLERAERLTGLLKQIQQEFDAAVTTERRAELNRADDLAAQFLSITREIEAIKNRPPEAAERLDLSSLRNAFSEYYALTRVVSVQMIEHRKRDMESEFKEAGEKLRVIREGLQQFQEESYNTFTANLRRADDNSRRALRVSLVTFLIAIFFIGAFSLLIRWLSEGLRRNVKDLSRLNERLEEMVRARTEQLQAKNREMEGFVYTVSHDLKAPVVSLQGMAYVLKEEYEGGLDDQGRHYLQRVIANAAQIESLIQNLLEFSELGSVTYTVEWVDSDALVQEVLDQFEGQIRDRNVGVNVRRPLPRVRFNRMLLQEVFSNLVGNAIKFLGDQPKPLIEIGASQPGGQYQFYVRDNGIGIEKAYHEKIFGVFQRLKEVETEGTGIGLAIVRRIVESNGGKVWVDSEKGQGSSFYFTIPHVAGDPSPPAESHEFTAGGMSVAGR